MWQPCQGALVRKAHKCCWPPVRIQPLLQAWWICWSLWGTSMRPINWFHQPAPSHTRSPATAYCFLTAGLLPLRQCMVILDLTETAGDPGSSKRMRLDSNNTLTSVSAWQGADLVSIHAISTELAPEPDQQAVGSEMLPSPIAQAGDMNMHGLDIPANIGVVRAALHGGQSGATQPLPFATAAPLSHTCACNASGVQQPANF